MCVFVLFFSFHSYFYFCLLFSVSFCLSFVRPFFLSFFLFSLILSFLSLPHMYSICILSGSMPPAASAKEHLQAYAAAQQRMSAAQAHFQHHYPTSGLGPSSRHANPHVAAAAQMAARAPPNVTVHPGYNDASVRFSIIVIS